MYVTSLLKHLSLIKNSPKPFLSLCYTPEATFEIVAVPWSDTAAKAEPSVDLQKTCVREKQKNKSLMCEATEILELFVNAA